MLSVGKCVHACFCEQPSFYGKKATAHETKEEAIEESRKMLDVYADFAENWLAMPFTKGVKTVNERFARADDTYTIEALMQDGKALQAGTSHFLGQNFANAFDVKFAYKEDKLDYVWATSWGVLEAISHPEIKKLNIKLLVAGEFHENKQPYLDLIEKYQLQHQLILHDTFIPNEDVRYYFCASNLVAQTQTAELPW